MEIHMQVRRKSVASTAVVAGLLLSFLSAIPAQAAATVTLTVNGVGITTATSSSTPASVSVPSDNSVDAADAVRFSLTGVDTGSTVTVAATNAFVVSTLSTTLNPVRSTTGVTSANYNVGTGTTSEFYAYTKSNTLGTIVITNAGSTFTYYLKGTAGPAYTLAYTAPTTPYTSTISKQSVTISDVFGNLITGVSPTLSLINLTSTSPSSSNADGVSEFTLTFPTTPGQSALGITIAATDVIGLPVAVKSISKFITVIDADATLSAAQASLAAEKAARTAEKAAADALLAAEKAARAADKSTSDAALAAAVAATAAEKTGRATDKTASDSASASALASEKANSATALAAEKAARAAEKTASDAALAAEKAARAADKAETDKSIATLNARVATLTQQIASLKVLYNKLAVKFKQKTIK